MIHFYNQVAAVCKVYYFHIHGLRHVSAPLPDKVANTVVCSIVSSRLDYCNALFSGTSRLNLDRPESVEHFETRRRPPTKVRPHRTNT